MAERSNAQWLEALTSQGDAQREALVDLSASLRRAALFYVRRRLRGAEQIAADEIESLAEDSAQEASLYVLQKLDTFRGEAKLLTWADSIAVACAMAALRRRLWRDLSLDRVPDGWQEPAATAVANDGWSNPQLAAQRRAMWDVITEVVNADLTQRQRDVLNLVVINGVDADEVAERLEMTSGALYKMTHDARRKLKAGLLKRGFSTAEILHAFAAEG